jgi:SAM-dependent methyltransferase
MHTPEVSATPPRCHVCHAEDGTTSVPVLWPELVAEWELADDEAASVDRREGQSCSRCGIHLRSDGLAAAILKWAKWEGSLESWVASTPSLAVLEINKAGDLTPWLERLPGHRLVEYPDVDMQSLPFADSQWDLVVHSDTLEHVDDPVAGLKECRRVVSPAGAVCFTIPVIAGRLSRRRDGMAPSFHGSTDDRAYKVITEYGADFWASVLDAGFAEVRIVAPQWPDSFALIASV